jgi:hypothetical protein
MHVDKALLASGKWQMAIHLVYQARGTLSFEIEDDIGKSVALENILVDLERTGAYLGRS